MPPTTTPGLAAGADLIEMFQGTKYFLFGRGSTLTTSGDDEHRDIRCVYRENVNRNCSFSVKIY